MLISHSTLLEGRSIFNSSTGGQTEKKNLFISLWGTHRNLVTRRRPDAVWMSRPRFVAFAFDRKY